MYVSEKFQDSFQKPPTVRRGHLERHARAHDVVSGRKLYFKYLTDEAELYLEYLS